MCMMKPIPFIFLSLTLAMASVCGFIGTIRAADQPASAPGVPTAFNGGKSTWHDGFVRYDFVMDDDTLAITPFTRPEKEGFAVGAPGKGQRRCIVVVPNKPATGNPWSWQGC